MNPYGGYPPPGGAYPPPGGFHPNPGMGGYPPQQPMGGMGGMGGMMGPGANMGGKPGKKDKKGKKGKKHDVSFHQQQWYSQYYNQIQPHELQTLQQWFFSVDADRSGEISAYEMANAQWPGGIPLDMATCKKLIKVFDDDGNGQMSFYEFAALFKFVNHMQHAFARADTARRGLLQPHELTLALQYAGFPVDPSAVSPYLKNCNKQLPQNYQQMSFAGSPFGLQAVPFTAFIALTTNLAYIRAMFSKSDPMNRGQATFTLDTFMRVVLRLAE